MGPIKYSALRAKASPRRVAAWRERVLREVEQRDVEQRGEHEDGAPPSTGHPRALRASFWVGIVGLLTLISGALSVTAGVLELTDRGNTGGLSVAAVIATLAFGVSWVVLQKQVREIAEGWRDPYRLMSFAKDNGFHAVPVATPADLPGRIFHRGLDEHRVRLDVVAWVQGGRQCHVATECWSTGEPPGGGTPVDEGSCRYLAVHIGQEPLPRVVFDALDDQGPGTSAHPTARGTGSAADVAGLDPRVHTREGTERWAAALFSDRLTRLLSHSKQPRDAEVVGEWFIAYDLGDSDPLSASGWDRTFQVVAALPAYPLAPPSETDTEPLSSPAAEPATSRSLAMLVPRPFRRPARAM